MDLVNVGPRHVGQRYYRRNWEYVNQETCGPRRKWTSQRSSAVSAHADPGPSVGRCYTVS